MNILRNPAFAYSLIILLMSCQSSKPAADLLVYNATIYTVDSAFSTAEAMVIGGDKILETGSREVLSKKYQLRDSMDVGGRFIYPGFIDAHAHFVGYGQLLQRVNLVETESWEDVLKRTQEFAASHPGDWLLGRGWDQNDWSTKSFPDNRRLNEMFPDRPVLLTRIDGHAAIANQKALELAGIRPGDTVQGGEIVIEHGALTGLLIDNAVDLVKGKIPKATREDLRKALQDAEANCFAAGLTTIVDCGLSFETVDTIHALQESGEVRMRLYVMLSDEKKNYDYLEKRGIIKTPTLHVRSFKLYGDGALGSRGASLIEPYSDKPGHRGFLLSAPAHFDSVAARLITSPFQMCTHAIGDSGNRTILHIYAKYLGGKNDRRWRIEHAQVVHPDDFNLFGLYSIVPSVQPTHATSDMYWVGERLGAMREKSAYAYRQLMEENGWIPLGTDFPVEDISPLKTFLASVARKDAKMFPENGYQPENALTREQTIRGMTIWAAYSCFEENEKGSLEKGKLADFIILDRDLMSIPENEILQTRVLATYLGGKQVHGNR